MIKGQLKRFLLSGFLLVSFLLFTGAYHKFYVSITQVDINTDTHKLEISARVFTDDLESSILALTGKKLNMGTVKEIPGADSVLFTFIRGELAMSQDGNPLIIKFVGKEVESDVTWIYLESVTGISMSQPLIIRNAMLHDRFPDQKNIVNLRFGKLTSSQIHTKGKPEYAYPLN